ncbi:MAG: hypothetical protein DU429_06390 [Candidatus Tokpelaia sp.]|nr:MAG: hypothetical protein DU430_01770 [Candidatus Tokpelaia sp.]KAA6206344.1 MAG: hypothetical protein DU429_06390 [Candidatus Tokpelaia sp.]
MWKVTEGNQPFNVAIEDKEFIGRVERKEISFKKNDCLKCLIRETQFYSGNNLKKETIIAEVIALIPSSPPSLPAAQYEMPF